MKLAISFLPRLQSSIPCLQVLALVPTLPACVSCSICKRTSAYKQRPRRTSCLKEYDRPLISLMTVKVNCGTMVETCGEISETGRVEGIGKTRYRTGEASHLRE